MSTPLLGVLIRVTIGSFLTAVVSMVPSFARAQSAGDMVIVGGSSEEQAQLRAYWEELLQLNAANPQPAEQTPSSGQPAIAPETPPAVQPGASVPTPALPPGQPLTDALTNTPAQALPPGQTNSPSLETLPGQPATNTLPLNSPSGQPGIVPQTVP